MGAWTRTFGAEHSEAAAHQGGSCNCKWHCVTDLRVSTVRAVPYTLHADISKEGRQLSVTCLLTEVLHQYGQFHQACTNTNVVQEAAHSIARGGSASSNNLCRLACVAMSDLRIFA